MNRNSDVLLAMPKPGSRSTRPPRSLERSSPAIRRVLAGIRLGGAGELFPPVVRTCPEGVPLIVRRLNGAEDAERLAEVLARPEFRPLRDFIDELDEWARLAMARHRGLLAPTVLEVTSGDLYGPLVTDAFTACAAFAAAGRGVRPTLRALLDGFRGALDLFLTRLARDLRAGVFDGDRVEAPVVRLRSEREETHNGGQGVLRVHFRRGGVWAYKPRPAGGETLFLREGGGARPASLFELLNRKATSARVHLPTMRVRGGTGRDRFAYGWHEWIARPRQWGTIRRSPRLRLDGCRLSPRQAETFWRRAGSLSAACFAFGVADLFGGNVLVGSRPRDRGRPLAYPVDLEVFFAPLRGLPDTGLVADAADRGNHHVGFERLPRWCATGGPPACFVEGPRGQLLLRRRRTAWGREETRSVVADGSGRTGYGPHLLHYLRGMFDLWALLVVEREAITRFLERASRQCFVRVLIKSTANYSDELNRRLMPGRRREGRPAGPVRFSAEERQQLARFDVPYFFRRARGGPLLHLDPGAMRRRRAGRQQVIEPIQPPARRVRTGGQLEFFQLGVALRDAIAYVFPDVQPVAADPRLGVSVALDRPERGQVSFDWNRLGKRVTYSWEPGRMRIHTSPLAPDPVEPAGSRDRSLRARLLRIDRIDRALRSRWVETEFEDRSIERELETLTAAAVDWLGDVIDAHGWPGRSLVGPAAAEAACRLAQHANGHAAFQRRCLRLMREAAERRDIPLRHVAYMTDAVRIGAGRKQVFGTKFRRRGRDLVPLPIERGSDVDRRRREMGLEPLHAYAARLRRTFPGREASG